MKERKEKRKWGLIFFIVLIMIGTSFSFVFFGFSPGSENARYNGIKFDRLSDRWEAKINGKTAAFSFLPNEVENINVSEDVANMLQGKFEIDVTSDLNDSNNESIALAQHQMGLTFLAYSIYVRKGFTSNNTFNFPIINCSDATPKVPVVYFKHGNVTRIHSQNSCIIAESPSSVDFIKVKDRLLYSTLGVLK